VFKLASLFPRPVVDLSGAENDSRGLNFIRLEIRPGR
jgi:hypothetical protein